MVITSRIIREMRNACKCLAKKPKAKDNLGDPGIDRKVILKLILEK
jgi:hypothetical protein